MVKGKTTQVQETEMADARVARIQLEDRLVDAVIELHKDDPFDGPADIEWRMLGPVFRAEADISDTRLSRALDEFERWISPRRLSFIRDALRS
jgi:hypothetical protein